MGITNKQYNQIVREYERLRLNNVHSLDRRTDEIYKKIPKIREIHNEISSLSVKEAKARLLSEDVKSSDSDSSLKETIARLSEQKKRLLTENGFPADYLSMHYTCEKCKDTGYIENEMCSCMHAKIVEILYEQSNIRELIDRENFSTFCMEYYSDDIIDENTGLSSKTNMIETLNICHDFVNNFKEGGHNLLIYGVIGVGKTFLINCIAKELIDRSFSVIYMSAIQFFHVLEDASFHRGENLSAYESTVQRDFYECDLLIIDDLGTEIPNAFTSSSLFHCINERAIRKKPLIISTNLALGNLRDIYSDRIFSRIASNFKMLKIFGKDLRILKSLY